MKQQLPNGCHIGKMSVTPSNWETKQASTKEDWYISYRFYDSEGRSKQRIVKGMNEYKTLKERQEATQACLDFELKLLKEHAFNPITKTHVSTDELLQDVNSQTPLMEALWFAYKKCNKAKSTMDDIKCMLKAVEKVAIQKHYDILPISSIGVKHIKLILDGCKETITGFSPDRHNKFRSYLMILFSELIQYEAVKGNVPRDVKKQKVIKKIRLTLTDEERVKVDAHLKTKHFHFWRLMHIFFHSGSRETELMKVRVQDVELHNQRFKVTVLKGRSYAEEWRIIKNVALPYWTSLLAECGPNDYLFSTSLKPSPVYRDSEMITKYWRKFVKAPVDKGGLGIQADFYSLKHLHTTEIVDRLNEAEAARMNGHKSTAMVVNIYDTKNKGRKEDALKGMDNAFAK